MEELAVFLRVVLALLLLSSAWPALRKIEEHVAVIKEYRILPVAWAALFGRVEVYAKGLVGVCLLLGLFVEVSLWVAMVLLFLYSWAMAINLWRGRREVSCGCGGAVGHHQLSWWLVVRNLLLIGLAVVSWQAPTVLGQLQALWQGAVVGEVFGVRYWIIALAACVTVVVVAVVNELQRLDKRMREPGGAKARIEERVSEMEKFLVVSQVVLWAFVLIQFAVILMLCKLVAGFLNRLRVQGNQVERATLKVGERAPLFREEDQHGNMVRLADHQGKHTLLLFSKAGCRACAELLPQVPELAQRHPELRVIVVADEGDLSAKGLSVPGVHYVRSKEAFENYLIQSTPTAVLVDAEGDIAAIDAVSNFKQLIGLLQQSFRLAG